MLEQSCLLLQLLLPRVLSRGRNKPRGLFDIIQVRLLQLLLQSSVVRGYDRRLFSVQVGTHSLVPACLLYTSDAADE